MRMRAFLLLLTGMLAGCAGQVRDFIGERSTIVSPQLIRYGLDVDQSRCVSQRLATMLRPRQLRIFSRAAGAVRQGYYDPARMTLRDLMWVARSLDDREIVRQLEQATTACAVGVPVAVAPPPGVAPPNASGAAATAAAPAWLNLGAAGSGQAIAVNAATIEQDGSHRRAWFRLTDPGAAPSLDSFLLDIDCTHRTINARARERHDAAGAVAQHIDYPDNPLAVEGGTVMEIAWLSLCT